MVGTARCKALSVKPYLDVQPLRPKQDGHSYPRKGSLRGESFNEANSRESGACDSLITFPQKATLYAGSPFFVYTGFMFCMI